MKFLIDFKADASDADISAYMQQHGCTVLKEWNKFDKIFLVEADLMPPDADITDRITEENHLAIKPLDVITLNPYYGTHRDPNKETITLDTNENKDWWKNYSRGQPEFTEATTTIQRQGQNINVYIMDSGIEASHPEFANADITNIYSVTSGDFSDNNGHGTAIASVIAGQTCGITQSKLKIVKIFDPNHTTTEHEFLDALDAIINDHVDNTYSVLNASWSIPKNAWVENKLRVLEDEGVFIVAAAGNNGTSIEDVTPAGMIDVITVGAYNKDLLPCDFSNFTGGSMISVTGGTVNHGELDGWAPGEEIWAAGLNGTYGYVAGTSIAAAVASAILASNLTHRVYEDTGVRVEGWQDLTISTAAIGSNTIIFKRTDLLDLTDPKYQNSVNMIATLTNRDDLAVNQAPDEISIHYRVGEPIQRTRVYEPIFTKTIEWIQPLPENFLIIPDGRVYGNPVESQGPGEGESYKLYNCSFIRTSIDDSQETVLVNIYIIPENLVPDTIPSDDPIQILLQFEYCQGLPQNCTYNGGVFCPDSCFDVCCSSGNGKDSTNCVCSG
jgi:subtilisin family serine protease